MLIVDSNNTTERGAVPRGLKGIPSTGAGKRKGDGRGVDSGGTNLRYSRGIKNSRRDRGPESR